MPEHESVWSDLQGVAFSQGYLDAGGVRTRYLHAGDEDKPALVFLHGSGGHAEAYVRNLEAHAEHFSTWSIDMLGHGYTDKPGHPLEVSHYVEHLMAFFDAIGAERVHLSGESLGGWVASRAAIDHPDRIDRLVLNTAGGSQADPEVMKRIITLSMAAVESADVGDRAGPDQVADGRQVQGLRRHRRQQAADLPATGLRRRNARHHGAAGSRDPGAKSARPEGVWRDHRADAGACGRATTRPPTSPRAGGSRR